MRGLDLLVAWQALVAVLLPSMGRNRDNSSLGLMNFYDGRWEPNRRVIVIPSGRSASCKNILGG
jgi:hypothetical protein